MPTDEWDLPGVTYCRAAICHIPKLVLPLYNSTVKEIDMFPKLRGRVVQINIGTISFGPRKVGPGK